MNILKWLDRLNIREKRLLLAVVIISAGCLFYIFAVEPLNKGWRSLDDKAEATTLKLKRSIKILRQKKDTDANYKEYIDRFVSKQTDEAEKALMLKQIENIARANGVRILNIKPRRLLKRDFYRMYYVDLQTEASLRNLLRFIKKLKGLEGCIAVEKLTLTSRAREPSILRGNLTISRLVIDSK